MKSYSLINNILGWLTFVIAAIVYLMTIEPTASFWDCGEFIVSAVKLEVGHPPGNPIFMLVGNLFTQLVSDPSLKPIMVNAMSAIFSALTILLLFWTITHLALKIIYTDKTKAISLSQIIAIMGCGLVGALVYTFSDTFWFSAVEGEVYAFSSLMTALVFWLILKWERVADKPHADRWLILIAYLMGISIAVHLLNLLCIPAIVLVYYFKKYPNPNWKGVTYALLISFGIIIAILYGVIQGIVEVAGWFELFFVNVVHLPYNYGVGIYMLVVFAILCWGIWETMQEKYNPTRATIAFITGIVLLGIPFIGSGIWLGIFLTLVLTGLLFYFKKKTNPAALNAILVGLVVITIGYSSYALIMIRSASNPPMDQNSPEDIFTLRTYLSREQYGETPLFYGRTYSSEPKREVEGNSIVTAMKDEGPVWTQIAKRDPSEKDRYFVSMRKEKIVYADELNMLFPRMHSIDERHIQVYKEWGNIKGRKVLVSTPPTNEYPQGYKYVEKPTFMENLRFFFSYQVNFMYWRYFLWNFSGRQNDIQGHGEVANGNWITGFKFIDKYLVGPQDDLPDFIAKNKGNNRYYMLPLLLGILGIFVQLNGGKKGQQSFWVIFLLFLMTGLAIVVYLNQPPIQPRERDYAYAGSFYAFSIWIGLGVAGVIRGLQNNLKVPPLPAAIAATLVCLLIPIQMASENWDDHDRSGRYLARDFGFNYLSTCEPNAIIFTNGDNDTFPLWYSQEVEGFRTDVRVCNLSYLQTDWYIDQMKRQAYESKPLPISWKKHEYIQGQHDGALVLPMTEEPWSVERALNRVKSDDIRTKKIPGYGEMDNIPTQTLYIPVDSAAVIKSGLVKPENADWIPDSMIIDLGARRNSQGDIVTAEKRLLGKHELMILEMLNNNKDWSRPFYFAISVGPEYYMRLEPYFRRDGVAFRVLPYEAVIHETVNTDVLYDNLMNKYRWGNLEQPGLYIDENAGRMTRTFRLLFGDLGKSLVKEGKTDKAKKAMDYAITVIPDYNVPYDYYSSSSIAETYYQIGEKENAKEIYDKMITTSLKNLNWYSRLKPNDYVSVLSDIQRDLSYTYQMLAFYQEVDKDLFEQYYKEFIQYSQQFDTFLRRNSSTGSGGVNQ